MKDEGNGNQQSTSQSYENGIVNNAYDSNRNTRINGRRPHRKLNCKHSSKRGGRSGKNTWYQR
jgi:hypothetical protein